MNPVLASRRVPHADTRKASPRIFPPCAGAHIQEPRASRREPCRMQRSRSRFFIATRAAFARSRNRLTRTGREKRVTHQSLRRMIFGLRLSCGPSNGRPRLRSAVSRCRSLSSLRVFATPFSTRQLSVPSVLKVSRSSEFK